MARTLPLLLVGPWLVDWGENVTQGFANHCHTLCGTTVVACNALCMSLMHALVCIKRTSNCQCEGQPRRDELVWLEAMHVGGVVARIRVPAGMPCCWLIGARLSRRASRTTAITGGAPL